MGGFELRSVDGKARCGVLGTAHGEVSTPAFMPVATKAVVKTLTPAEVRQAGAEAIIANSLHLHLRPGAGAISSAGGIHSFMGWQGAVFTDSGGFQLIRSGFDLKVREGGVKFRNSATGAVEELTPERSAALQRELGSDVAMVLDDCPRWGTPRDMVALSARRTVEWARRAKDAEVEGDQLSFAIVQGGLDEALRKECADALVSMDFDGYGIGGLSIGEPREEMMDALRSSLSCIPASRPRYLMGVGSARELLDAVAEGVDIFDSAFPTRNARHWTIMTASGNFGLLSQSNASAQGPLEEGCICPTCRTFSRAYLHHLGRENEMLGMRLASIHNLFFLGNLLSEARQAVREHRFERFRAERLERIPRPAGADEEE